MLPDVNVLIALAWPNHVHHGLARQWFLSEAAKGWATCPITESGFVRVSSNRAVMPHAVAPGEAIALLRRLRREGGHEFVADDVSIVDAEEFKRDHLIGHRQITDAHLVALARRSNRTLVTFDGGVRSLIAQSERATVRTLRPE